MSDLSEFFSIQRERNLRGNRLGIDGYCDIEALDGKELTDFIRWNVQAAQVELNEALDETTWKVWKTYAGGHKIKNRAAYVEELIDVLNFVGNLLLAARVTPEELMQVMRNKDEIIAQRQIQSWMTLNEGDRVLSINEQRKALGLEPIE